MPIDYSAARTLLEETLAEVETAHFAGSIPLVAPEVSQAFDLVFASTTQAYREVLLGCVIARIQDKDIDIRLPYVNQGSSAYNGRTLDERVVNPFLHSRQIPSTRGPYLSVFRRSVKLDTTTREGQRDKAGYDAFLSLISYLEALEGGEALHSFLSSIVYRFIILREAAAIPVASLQRISLEQCDTLLAGLLATPSGGRFPVFLVVAAFRTLKTHLQLPWDISWQGINVADAASGAGGDVTIRTGDKLLLAAEVTERPMDQARVEATFRSKIAVQGMQDYLFFVDLARLQPGAIEQARQYFAQGHEVNFVEVKNWILMTLATLGQSGRRVFMGNLVELLDSPDTPKSMKVAWNDTLAALASGRR